MKWPSELIPLRNLEVCWYWWLDPPKLEAAPVVAIKAIVVVVKAGAPTVVNINPAINTMV